MRWLPIEDESHLGDLNPGPMLYKSIGPHTQEDKCLSSLTKASLSDLSSCLALLRQNSPDLALVVERWDGLPEPVRAGIMAMVKAAKQ